MVGNKTKHRNFGRVEIRTDLGSENNQDNELIPIGSRNYELDKPISVSISAFLGKALRDWRRKIIRVIDYQNKNVGNICIDGIDYRITANVIINMEPTTKSNGEEEFKNRVRNSLGIKLPQ